MISKILLRKCGFGKPKAFNNDAHDNSSSSSTEVEHGPQDNSNSQSDKNRSSSKFYVGVEDNLAISGDFSPENSLQIADEDNDGVACVVSDCIYLNDACCTDSDLSRKSEKIDKSQVDFDLSRVFDKMSNSQVASIKPEVKPKPKVSSPSMQLRMPSTSTVCPGQSCSMLGISSPPVTLLPCVRGSIFPPAQDVWIHTTTKCSRNEGKPESSLSSDKMAPMMNNVSNSLQVTRLANRGSRRSFTTDDADIGLYKKPIMSPDLSATAKPNIMRRKPGSGVGLMVNTFERMTACRRSRSFSSNQKVELPSVPELQPVSNKPKPPVKPRIVNWNQDVKAGLNCKPSSFLTSADKISPAVVSPVASSAINCPNATADSSKALQIEETSYFSETPQLDDILVEAEPQQKSENFSEKICNHLQSDMKENSFSDDDSEFEDDEDWNEDDYNACNMEVAAEPEIVTDKAQKVAEELLKTEEAYVSRLKLLDQVFLMEIMEQNRNEHFLPDDVIPQMFSSIKSIFLFHNDFLLPQLRVCMTDWNSGDKKIGRVLKKFAPFLKLYTDYVKNFENATNLISSYVTKSPRFATFLDELQRRPVCGNLTLQHHLLEPIQRVPRYEMLLRDYLKHLPEDSEDRVHASEALELVTRAAQHSNTEMRKIEKFRSLLDLNESLGGTLDLVDHTRELIKEGKIIKISARDGDHSERYLFLFNDMLLVCQSVPLKLGLRQQYTIKAKLDIRGMQVLEGNNLETANTFVIKSKQKSIEFCGSSLEYKDEWQRALWCAISEYTKKEHSRNTDQNLFNLFQEEELGKRAPTWVKDQEVTMCMLCTERFNTFKRRHHCRCCGKVVCKRCSAYKTKLAYDESHEHRVCARCSSALGLQEAASAANIPGRNKACAVLQVNATDPSVLSGYLQMSSDKKTWNRKFFAIHTDFVLYSFKAHQDVIAHTSVPLPGFEVKSVEKSDEVQQRDFVFSLTKPGLIDRASSKTYYFQADDESQRKRWIETLNHVVKLELPNSTSSGATSSSSSSVTSKPSVETVAEQMEDKEAMT